jgi:hypothetical protein
MVGSKNQLCAPEIETQIVECFDEMLCSHTCLTGVSGKCLSILDVCEWIIIKCFVCFVLLCPYGHNVYCLPAAFIPASVPVIAARGGVEQ